MRRKISKIVRLASDKTYGIIRFDNLDLNENLLTQPTNRAVQFSKSTIGKHAQILKHSAAQGNTVCLAANQICLSSNLIAIHKNIKEDKTKNGEISWINQQYNQVDQYRTFVHPQIQSGKEIIERIQESISYPFILFKVKRYNKIVVKFRDENNNKFVEQLQGFQSCVFQQIQEQIIGQSLLDWRINHGNMWFNQEMIEYFPKSVSVIEEYVRDLGKVFKQYPDLISKVNEFNSNKQRQNVLQNEILPFESDFTKRLVKHYSREMERLQEKIINGFPELPMRGQPRKLDVKVLKK